MVLLNIAGRLIDFSTPQVMGIINVTPDSFYAGSRTPMTDALLQRAEEMVEQGAVILDVGACSTRPDSTPVSADEELRRLDTALAALTPLRDRYPDIIISLDTVQTNAQALEQPYLRELHRVIIHGILHLCGINDKGPGEREIMEAAENQALQMILL